MGAVAPGQQQGVMAFWMHPYIGHARWTLRRAVSLVVTVSACGVALGLLASAYLVDGIIDVMVVCKWRGSRALNRCRRSVWLFAVSWIVVRILRTIAGRMAGCVCTAICVHTVC